MVNHSKAAPELALEAWLERALSSSQRDWLRLNLEKIEDTESDQSFYIAFGMASRKLGKDTLEFSSEDLEMASAARPGWLPMGLSVDQAARLVLVLKRSRLMGEGFFVWLDQLISTGDVAEQVALYLGLPLYPFHQRLVLRAQEGLRTNIKTVFEAIAQRSPFPSECFEENAWNHMVLKALFVGSPLYPIQGLEKRANGQLTRMLTQYAHERWAAKRKISPELWRCVGAQADEGALLDLKRVLESPREFDFLAAALALNPLKTERPEIVKWLEPYQSRLGAIESGEMNWDVLGKWVESSPED